MLINEIENIKSGKKQLRKFGITIGIALGLLGALFWWRGKDMYCYPSLASQLPDSESANQPVVVDGNCITSQGPGTALKFALKLAEILLSREKAKEIANAMLVDKTAG